MQNVDFAGVAKLRAMECLSSTPPHPNLNMLGEHVLELLFKNGFRGYVMQMCSQVNQRHRDLYFVPHRLVRGDKRVRPDLRETHAGKILSGIPSDNFKAKLSCASFSLVFRSGTGMTSGRETGTGPTTWWWGC